VAVDRQHERRLIRRGRPRALEQPSVFHASIWFMPPTARFICRVSGPSVPPAASLWQTPQSTRLGKFQFDRTLARAERDREPVVGDDGRVGLRLVPAVAVAVPSLRVGVHEQARLDALAVEHEGIDHDGAGRHHPLARVFGPLRALGRRSRAVLDVNLRSRGHDEARSLSAPSDHSELLTSWGTTIDASFVGSFGSTRPVWLSRATGRVESAGGTHGPAKTIASLAPSLSASCPPTPAASADVLPAAASPPWAPAPPMHRPRPRRSSRPRLLHRQKRRPRRPSPAMSRRTRGEPQRRPE
jgi:hypothetical protein